MKDYILIKNFLDDETIEHYLKLSKKYTEHYSKVGKRIGKEKKIRKDIFFNKKDSCVIDNVLFNTQNSVFKDNFNIDIKYRETYKLGTYYGDEKGFYTPHTDTQGGMNHRKISIVSCLSNQNDYEGGMLNLVDLDTKFKFDKGDAIIFRSDLLHGVEPVTSGKRQVLISFMWDEDGEKIRSQYSKKESSNYLPNNKLISKNQKIFVSIACFLDKDIINTIENCLKMAKNPYNITFGICLQYDPEDDFFKKYKNHPQVKLIEMHYSEAKGPAYARYICTQLITDEDYFLQIDCHTRFFEDWDELALKCWRQCDNPKSIITNFPLSISFMNNRSTYPLNVTPKKWKKLSYDTIWNGFGTNSRKIFNPKSPTRTYVISAAFVFGPIQFVKDVPYDPHVIYGYHKTEQVFYSVRLFTYGWDLYCPTKHILATKYGRGFKVNSKNVEIGMPYKKIQCKNSWNRVCYYYGLKDIDDVDPEYKKDLDVYGLGKCRSLNDFFICINADGCIEKIKSGLYYEDGVWYPSNK